MVWAAVAGWRIAMPRLNDLDFHFFGAMNGRIEIIKLKPQKHAVSVRLEILIAYRTVMVFHIPLVQLQDESPIRNKPIVLRATVRALAAKQTLIPATARFDITHANQRLWAHRDSVVKFHKSLMASTPVPRLCRLRYLSWLTVGGVDDAKAPISSTLCRAASPVEEVVRIG
jgi:hypothetical protein